MSNLLSELKRRNVFKVGVAYLALGWVIIEVTSMAVPALNLPESLNSIVFYLGLVGFPIAIFFAWAFELTPDGIKATGEVDPNHSISQQTGNKLEHLIVGLLSVAVIFLLWDNYNKASNTEVTRESPPVEVAVADKEETYPSIAVLPFVNMSPDADQEYFSDGISEEILNVLAKIPNLHVTSRSSAFAFKGKELDLTEVAKKLGVNHILEGSVRKSGTRVRITAQLIEAGSDKHLWSETYTRELDDVFAIQDELSAAIGAILKVKLMGDNNVGHSEPSKVTPEAYTAYLRGRHFSLNGTSIDDVKTARSFYEQSIAIDPNFAPAHAARSRAIQGLTSMAYIPLSEGVPLARAAVERAIALDPTLANSYLSRSRIKSDFDFDFIGAKADLEHALELNPNRAGTYISLSSFASLMGNDDDSIAFARKAVALDPVNPYTISRTSLALLNAGRNKEALIDIELALDLLPNSQFLMRNKGFISLALGNYNEALSMVTKDKDEAFRPQLQAMAHYSLGDQAASDEALATLIKDAADDSAYQIAEVYCYRAEVEKCLEWLDTSFDQLDPGLVSLARSPHLKYIHSEPRYEAMLERIGIASMIDK